MHTVSRSSSRFNMGDFANALLANAAGRFNPELDPIGGPKPLAAGHPDECTALLASPDDSTAADHEGYSEYLADQAIQHADDTAAAEIRDGNRYAKELLGNVRVDLVRVLSVNSATGQPIVGYAANIAGSGMMVTGAGNSPREAVDNAIARVDRRAGILPLFAGFTVRGVALVQGWPVRSKADALALARRIALEPAYLTAAIDFACPGIIPVTPAPAAVAA